MGVVQGNLDEAGELVRHAVCVCVLYITVTLCACVCVCVCCTLLWLVFIMCSCGFGRLSHCLTVYMYIVCDRCLS